MSEVESLVFVYGTLRKGGVRALPSSAPTSRDLGEAAIRDFPDRPEASYYLRVPVTARQATRTVACWTYEVRPECFELGPTVESGDWIAHFATKTHVPEERWPNGLPIQKG